MLGERQAKQLAAMKTSIESQRSHLWVKVPFKNNCCYLPLSCTKEKYKGEVVCPFFSHVAFKFYLEYC